MAGWMSQAELQFVAQLLVDRHGINQEDAFETVVIMEQRLDRPTLKGEME